MGSSQQNSGRARTKRDGIPNNPMIRKQLRKIAADQREGMTYAKRRAMREAAGVPKPSARVDFGKAGMPLKAAPKGPMEVRYRALAKKIRQCEELERKRREGAELDPSQVKKLQRKPFLKLELRNLVKAAGGSGGGEEDDESSGEDEDAEEDAEMSESDE